MQMPHHMIDRPASILEAIDLTRIAANKTVFFENKSELGQFLTPAPVAKYMASLFKNINRDEIRLLDPGAGIGNLTAAFVERLLQEEIHARLFLEVFEVDNAMRSFLAETISIIRKQCNDKNIALNNADAEYDFIESAAERLGLFDTSSVRFTHCIMNPPYKKISSASKHSALLRAIGIEASNLYSAFLALAIKLLEPGGELVAIIPRSFCNGVYFKPFRRLLLQSMSLRRIHVFESRTNSFADDDVLQENIIIHAIKETQSETVNITSSTDASLEDLTERRISFSKVVKPADKDQFIHIATSEIDQAVVDRISVFDNNLADLGIDVGTGPVVDFRLKEHIGNDISDHSCPLIYPCHFQNGVVDWPNKDGKKPNTIKVNKTTRQWLLPNGCYTLTRRFSSKEEHKRLVAAIYEPQDNPAEMAGFENHLNVFHHEKQGLDPLIAKGLFVFLSSTLLDMYFRQFSGHTQVNATDLRQLHYPDIAIITEWGRQFDKVRESQEAVDDLVDKTIDGIYSEENKMNPRKAKQKIQDALKILIAFGVPRAQQNDRSALTLLALLDIRPDSKWNDAKAPLIGITPIMDFSRDNYGKEYAPNTRETFRRQTMHQFVEAGIAIQNPDKPDRAINSPKWVYQIAPDVLDLVKLFGTNKWNGTLKLHLTNKETLAEKYANHRKMQMIPLTINGKKKLSLSPGGHSQLIKDIIELFGPRYAPGAEVLYVGDTGSKLSHFDKKAFLSLGLKFDDHGKFPDVILYYRDKNWLLLIESVTSHGPVDAKRQGELKELFTEAKAGLIFVTAFPNRKIMAKYLPEISWETEVWSVDAPTHLIHFNGEKFLGPYEASE